MAEKLLHGTLNVTIYEAQQLTLGKGDFLLKLEEKIEELIGHKLGEVYFTVDIGGATVASTSLLQYHHSSLTWNQQFHVYCAHTASNLVFTLKKGGIIPTTIGRAYLSVTDIQDGNEIDLWLDIVDEDHNPITKGSRIHVKVQYLDVSTETYWDQGIKDADFPGVPFTFFPQRNSCGVTLYQDSHVSDNFAPKIPLADGKYYEPHRCWEDIFDAISNAKYLIYIAGWSVYTEITLVRDAKNPNPMEDMTLGELLMKKAQEGVRVLMLIWDNPTNMTETHARETSQYFAGSEVHCVSCPRFVIEKGKGVAEDLVMSFLFTHHQKTVVVDTDESNNNMRTIVSFVGGIDLCDGRYDTQSHSLFRTLNTVNKNDFYQPSIKGSSIEKGGPREPWHDIHSKLQGLVAWDVLFNFEQRWKKQSGMVDLLLDLHLIIDIFIPPSDQGITLAEDQDTWKVQVFRSIDGNSVEFPTTPEEAFKVGLISDKNNIIDRSIQDAYIQAIRRAKRFIYIENQYFLGSSFDWQSNMDVGANHLIPKELSLKIVSKIEKGERFTVYVVMPMWPEGEPESQTVQAILYWQTRTMEMMYTDVIQALRAKGMEADPKDYLSFFCLGNREVKKSGEYEPIEKPENNTDYSWAQMARRFMVYVHAKMMIVDDEYILIGSANINQRSMDGGRDTEIAMGAFQPYQINQAQKQARGEIHGFRMSLWYEHLGMLDDIFLNPESTECVRKVNQIAENYWEMYTSETLTADLPGNLLQYPVGISDDGHIVQLSGFEHFPDTSANTLGNIAFDIPSIFTT